MRTGAVLSRLLLVGLVLSTMAAHIQLQGRRSLEQEGERRLLAGVLSPAEMASATLLGGFRSIAIDIIWIRLIRYQHQQRFEELPELYGALEVLQGNSPALYRILANQMILDIPHYLPHRPEERWGWIRQGLDLLERGIRRFPENLSLLREAAFIYYLRFDPYRSPGDRRRFIEEHPRPGGAVAYGQDPILHARQAAERYLEDRDHDFEVGVLLWDIYILLLSMDEEVEESPGPADRQELLEAARRHLDHIEKVHRDVPKLDRVFPLWRNHLERLEHAEKELHRENR